MCLKKKLLFLSPTFFPEPIGSGLYNTYLVKALVENGMDVTVLSSHPLYPDWKPRKSHAEMEGVTIRRGGLRMAYPRSTLFRRMFLELWYAWYVVTSILVKRETCDCIVSVFPPTLFQFFLALLMPKHITKVGIVIDLQSVYAAKPKGFLRRLVLRFINSLERRAFQSCDSLVFLSKSMARRACRDYRLDRNRCVVRYPFVTIMNNHHHGNNSALKELFPGDYIHVVYSGALGEKHKPDVLMNFFRHLTRKRSDVYCHIFSRGPNYTSLLKKHDPSADGRIIMHDLVPEKHLRELLVRSRVQVIPQAEGTAEGSFPSKLPNLLGIGVPVFAICDEGSELAEVINESGIGTAAHTWDTDLLSDRLSDFLDRPNGRSHKDRQVEVQDYVASNFHVQGVVDIIMKATKQ